MQIKLFLQNKRLSITNRMEKRLNGKSSILKKDKILANLMNIEEISTMEPL
jgi:hypothetical protein